MTAATANTMTVTSTPTAIPTVWLSLPLCDATAPSSAGDDDDCVDDEDNDGVAVVVGVDFDVGVACERVVVGRALSVDEVTSLGGVEVEEDNDEVLVIGVVVGEVVVVVVVLVDDVDEDTMVVGGDVGFGVAKKQILR